MNLKLSSYSRSLTAFCILLLSLVSTAKGSDGLFLSDNSVKETISSSANEHKFYAVEEISSSAPSYEIDHQWSYDFTTAYHSKVDAFSTTKTLFIQFLCVDQRAKIFRYLFPFHFFL